MIVCLWQLKISLILFIIVPPKQSVLYHILEGIALYQLKINLFT